MKAKIFISGDIVNTQNTIPFISNDLQKIIQEQDFSVCNFEAPIEGVGAKIIKAGPHLIQKSETIKLLEAAGFNLLLLANNHIYDYGEEALAKTMQKALEANLHTIGAGLNMEDAYKPLIKEINGIKIGFINACEAQFGVLDGANPKQKSGYAWINHQLTNELIKSTKKNVDKLIFFAHAGLEDYPVPLYEWKQRYRDLCDIGVDCIVGSHPHIPQGYEVYKNKHIFYSLGNFYFDTVSFESKPDHTYSLILEITKEEISFNTIFHHKANGTVRLTAKKEETFDLDILNSKILDDKILDKVYLDAYKNITAKYFASAFNSLQFPGSLNQFIKHFIKMFLFSKKIRKRREVLLFHLIRNETYRWVTQRAIALKKFKK